MTTRNQRLELTRFVRNNRPKPEPRIPLEGPEKPYHAVHLVSEQGFFGNQLIVGDNLLALKY